MQIFYDSKKYGWELVLSTQNYRRVLAELNIDLGLALYPMPNGLSLHVVIEQSPATLANILWVLCQKRAIENDISQDEFDDRVFGPPLAEALGKFRQEWIDFFLRLARPQDAELVRNAHRGLKLYKEENLELQRQKLAEPSPTASTNTPPSPESTTPVPSPSAN